MLNKKILGIAPSEDDDNYNNAFNYNLSSGTLFGAINGTIAGAVAGYKISGKWCS